MYLKMTKPAHQLYATRANKTDLELHIYEQIITCILCSVSDYLGAIHTWSYCRISYLWKSVMIECTHKLLKKSYIWIIELSACFSIFRWDLKVGLSRVYLLDVPWTDSYFSWNRWTGSYLAWWTQDTVEWLSARWNVSQSRSWWQEDGGGLGRCCSRCNSQWSKRNLFWPWTKPLVEALQLALLISWPS